MKRLIAVLIIFVSVINIFPLPSVCAAQEPVISAENTILIEQTTGKVLFAKNQDARTYPASTTKIMTALLALERGKLQDTVTVGDEVKTIKLDSSKAALKPGQHITLANLLKGLMLPSGNDAAMTIAVYIGRKTAGNRSMAADKAVQRFVDLMNARAKELGTTGTHFVNPHGYHNAAHYTTAHDLALIARQAMKSRYFREVVQMRTAAATGIGKVNGTAMWVNTNKLIKPGGKFYYHYATGIKTGHTDEAGYCLVSSAAKGGMKVIAVVLKGAEKEQWSDSIKLLQYGVDGFVFHQITTPGKVIGSFRVVNGKAVEKTTLPVATTKQINAIVAIQDLQQINETVMWDRKIVTPEQKNAAIRLAQSVSKGQVIGKVVYRLNGKELGITEITAAQDFMIDDSFIDRLGSIPVWAWAVGCLICAALAWVLFKKKR